MKLKPICFVAVLLSCIQARAQSPVAGWFPIHVGDKWVYDHETRDAGINGNLPPLEIHRWRTEETNIGSWTVAEGTVVLRQVRVIGSFPSGWYADPNRAYFVRGKCLYQADLYPSTRQLTADFQKELITGELAPDFCFPLSQHSKWGAPHGLPNGNVARPEDAKDWEVVAIEPTAPNGRTDFHISNISAYPGSGMTVDIWFEKGVGIVREDDIHHGTVDEIRTRLVRFEQTRQAQNLR